MRGHMTYEGSSSAWHVRTEDEFEDVDLQALLARTETVSGVSVG